MHKTGVFIVLTALVISVLIYGLTLVLFREHTYPKMLISIIPGATGGAVVGYFRSRSNKK
jgi:multidrug efflux pump subunit AcrB